MPDRPDAAELLAIAGEMLVQELLPGLCGEPRFAALMIANAMAIARREIQAGEAPSQAELTGLSALYGEPAPEVADSAALDAALGRFQRRLAEDLRDGAFDAPGPRREAVRRHLLETALRKVLISNPKYLESL